jgi:hypothetical protein
MLKSCPKYEVATAASRGKHLQNVLSEAVKVVNFIKLKHMNSQLFTALCEEMGSQFKSVASHTGKSRDKVLVQLFIL